MNLVKIPIMKKKKDYRHLKYRISVFFIKIFKNNKLNVILI